MSLRRWALSALLAALCAASFGQQTTYQRQPLPPLPLEPVERFSGPLPATRNPALAGARVVFRHWHIANDQRVEIPHEGVLILQLHAGEINVATGGEAQRRRGDEIWVVQPGERLIVETGRDSVMLRTLDTITAR